MLITVLLAMMKFWTHVFWTSARKQQVRWGYPKFKLSLRSTARDRSPKERLFPAKLFKFLVVAVVMIVLIVIVLVVLLKW